QLKKESFAIFFENLKDTIKHEIEDQSNNSELSQDKIERFYKESSRIISTAFAEYRKVFRPYSDQENLNNMRMTLSGASILSYKSAFIDGDIASVNYDTFFASAIARKIKQEIPNSFHIARTKRYLLNRNNIVLAIEKITS